MATTSRGADLLVKTLAAVGTRYVFALSGNQIMPIFDACIGSDIELVHVRHEAAAVHMADGWGRLTGEPGVALVTAGPGLANAVSAVYVATMSESPLVFLSGHAPLGQLGRGAFQEMAQADIVGHVAKASWTVENASDLGHDLARALRVAASGRPGPVHLSLPVNLLNAEVGDVGEYLPKGDDFKAPLNHLDTAAVGQILDAVAKAKKPLILAGPAAMRGAERDALTSMEEAAGVPVLFMESPRGTNDPSLGAVAEVLAEADLVLLLGKKLDFTVGFGDSPTVGPDCRFVQIDPDAEVLEQTSRTVGDSSRLLYTAVADTLPAAAELARSAGQMSRPNQGWFEEVRGAVSYRTPGWSELRSSTNDRLHAAEIGRAVQHFLDGGDETVFVSDGGEFGQWAQAGVSTANRLINGPGGSIGTALPLALAARLAYPDARVVAMLGDGTFGFHAMEFDTAVRNRLPFVAVVGNDAAWNAEYQIQLRNYGPDRLVGCELLPTRYDEMVKALGGYGELVTSAAGLPAALERAHASGVPACINVALERNAAPTFRRKR